jgi:amino acid permease
MNEIIDFPEKEEPKFLKKSAKLYKIYGGIFIFVILGSWIIRPLFLQDNPGLTQLLDALVGFSILSLFVFAPMGLYYGWKSYREKEGHSKLRMKYTLGHVLVCMLLLLFMGIFVIDISVFF